MAKTSQETHQPSTHNQQHPKSIFLTRSIRKEHNRTLLKTFAHCKITRGKWANEISPISETELFFGQSVVATHHDEALQPPPALFVLVLIPIVSGIASTPSPFLNYPCRTIPDLM
jgi:hypothetical protein